MIDDTKTRRDARGPSERGRLHRIGEVMKVEGVSARAAARRMQIPLSEVQRQARPDTDLKLTELYHWQATLGLPVAELLVKPKEGLSEPLRIRGSMVRVMKTAKLIQEASTEGPAEVLSSELVEQLVAIAPELAEITAWPAVGRPRSAEEYGAIVERVVDARLLREGEADGRL